MAVTKAFILERRGDLEFYTIPAFEQTGMVKACFSTRKGGVSTAPYDSLNLGFKRMNSRESVVENFHRFAAAVGFQVEDMVFSDQVHRDKIAAVGTRDRGKGFLKESDIRLTDGLVTNQKGVALVTFYADCVPLYLLDTKHRAIGLSHSGWRGTVARIGQKTLLKMKEEYGTEPESCLVAIGPSIGPCCFEVDEPVVEAFAGAFPWATKVVSGGGHGKYHIDLWEANRLQFLDAGVPDGNIYMASLCTACHTDRFFSYRKEAGKTGSMIALMMLI